MFYLKCFMLVCSFQINMKQHQRKQRDSPALYKELCELLKYWDLITDNILTSEFSCADLEAAFGSRNADSPFSMTAWVYQAR